MDHYAEIAPVQWDLSHHSDLSALGEPDFLSILAKQFPSSNLGALGFGGYTNGVNPQNLNAYELPGLTPPSDDSPSPSNSNQDHHNDDREDSLLKRKASDESLSDEPSQKTQHTCENHP